MIPFQTLLELKDLGCNRFYRRIQYRIVPGWCWPSSRASRNARHRLGGKKYQSKKLGGPRFGMMKTELCSQMKLGFQFSYNFAVYFAKLSILSFFLLFSKFVKRMIAIHLLKFHSSEEYLDADHNLGHYLGCFYDASNQAYRRGTAMHPICKNLESGTPGEMY